MTAKEETTNGLLSKVVKFVKNPTTNWGDLDHQEGDRESSYSKQMLKEMIERKRRNDFVRKREFDMLRKMRRSEVMVGQDPAARPSFFQSSMPSKPDDRATTLKKIDEIEAQMSMQWWKTKHGEGVVRPGAAANMPMPPTAPQAAMDGPAAPERPASLAPVRSAAYSKTEPMPLQATVAGAAYDQTVPADLTAMREAAHPVAAPAIAPVSRASAPAKRSGPGVSTPLAKPPAPPAISAVTALAPHSETGANSAFTASKAFAIDVGEFAHDPELEEAAIRFANADYTGAEAGLLEVLGPKGLRINHDETWLTLFDLYRATGQQDRFETAAIEFADRFARSAPQWISLLEAGGRMGSVPAAAPAAGKPVADWTCPSTLGTQSLATLGAALAKATPPWRLSWVKLSSIDDGAVEGLIRLFTQWAGQHVQLRFIGAEKLEELLKRLTPSGDREANPHWWKLRMEMLRVMDQADEFELVALDYCVTYEVSPPSWESARCDYRPLGADGAPISPHPGSSGETDRDVLSSSSSLIDADTHASGLNSQASSLTAIELKGQILGDATEVLERLEKRGADIDALVISCDRLIRIDFSAAGTLLNWVTARQAEGRQVQFVQVHRLVAVFFNVIGISEHARVLARYD